MASTFEKRLSVGWNDIAGLGNKIGGTYVLTELSPEEKEALGVDANGFLNSNLGAGGYKPAKQSLLEGYATYADILGLPKSGTGLAGYISMLKSTRGSVV
jgi:hypothetical protein